MQRLAGYVADPAPECLVARFASAPADAATAAIGQLPHWMFALADTLPLNTFRALGLLATHPVQLKRAREEIAVGDRLPYVAAALEESMRLWPTTPLLARETLEETEWGGVRVAAGTQVVISNTFSHRDRATHDFADSFAPEVWTEGRARGDWAFNHFSNGPQVCPGAALALLVGARVLATALTAGELRLRGIRAASGAAAAPDARRFPHALRHQRAVRARSESCHTVPAVGTVGYWFGGKK